MAGPGAGRGEIFARQGLIRWLDLGAVEGARVLVLGAGALGNETLKALVLSGFRSISIVDRDMVEPSNLSRSPLFRKRDAGERKVAAAARALKEMMRNLDITELDADLERLDETAFSGFRVVLGCLDNIAARLHANAHVAALGTPYIDGGTDGLRGKVHVFIPPDTGCLECAMNESHRRALRDSYSCTGERTGATPEVASEITTTSIVASIMVREALKMASNRNDLACPGLTLYDGLAGSLERHSVPRAPGCRLHGVFIK